MTSLKVAAFWWWACHKACRRLWILLPRVLWTNLSSPNKNRNDNVLISKARMRHSDLEAYRIIITNVIAYLPTYFDQKAYHFCPKSLFLGLLLWHKNPIFPYSATDNKNPIFPYLTQCKWTVQPTRYWYSADFCTLHTGNGTVTFSWCICKLLYNHMQILKFHVNDENPIIFLFHNKNWNAYFSLLLPTHE